jgi:hypothetical protein
MVSDADGRETTVFWCACTWQADKRSIRISFPLKKVSICPASFQSSSEMKWFILCIVFYLSSCSLVASQDYADYNRGGGGGGLQRRRNNR